MRLVPAILALAAIVLVGCSGESDSSASGTPESQPATETPMQDYSFGESEPGEKAQPESAAEKAQPAPEEESPYTGPAAPHIEKLGSNNSTTRDRAADRLVDMGEAAVDMLIAALNDRSGNIRANAAWVLGQIKDKKAVEPLIKAARDRSAKVRSYAALALGKLGDERAIPVLNAAVNDTDRDVRMTAEQALKKLEPERAARAETVLKSGAGPEAVMRAFISALAAKNPAGLYSCISKASKKQVATELARIKNSSG